MAVVCLQQLSDENSPLTSPLSHAKQVFTPDVEKTSENRSDKENNNSNDDGGVAHRDKTGADKNASAEEKPE